MHPSCAQRMARQRFSGIKMWDSVSVFKGFSNCFQFLNITYRRASTMGIDIVNWFLNTLHGHFHAADSTFTGRLNHIKPIRGRAVATNLGINPSTPRLSPLTFLNDYNSSSACNNKTIPICIKCSGSHTRVVIIS